MVDSVEPSLVLTIDFYLIPTYLRRKDLDLAPILKDYHSCSVESKVTGLYGSNFFGE